MAQQETIERMLAKYSGLVNQAAADSGLELSFLPGTTLYEVLVKPAAGIFADMVEDLEEFYRNMTLRQLLEGSEPDDQQVLNLLSNYNYEPKTGETAAGILTVRTATSRNVYISSGTRITCGGVTLFPRFTYIATAPGNAASDTDTSRYVEMRELSDGTWVFGIQVTAPNLNGQTLYAGQTCAMELQDASVTDVRLGTTIQNNAPDETPQQLLARAKTSMNAHVVTGRDNLQAMLLNNTEYPVSDVLAIGLGDPEMLRNHTYGLNIGGCIDAYLRTAVVPSTSEIQVAALQQTDGSYLAQVPAEYAGAYGVLYAQFGALTLSLPPASVSPDTVTVCGHLTDTPDDVRFSACQALSVRLPSAWSTLPEITVTLAVQYMPGIGELQSFLDAPAVRSKAIDVLAKAVAAVFVGVRVTVQIPAAGSVVTADVFETAIKNRVNSRPPNAGTLYSSEIVTACREVLADCTVVTPMRLTSFTWLLDGRVRTRASSTSVQFPSEQGISERNAVMFCTDDVQVTVIQR